MITCSTAKIIYTKILNDSANRNTPWLPRPARFLDTLRMLEEAIVQYAVKQYGFVALLHSKTEWCDW